MYPLNSDFLPPTPPTVPLLIEVPTFYSYMVFKMTITGISTEGSLERSVKGSVKRLIGGIPSSTSTSSSISTNSTTITNFIIKNKSKKLGIAMHRGADLDALASAYALSTIFPNATILTPDEMNKPAKNFANYLKIDIKKFKQIDKDKDQFEGLIVVDCKTYSMIKEAKGWRILCIIDHHQKCNSEEITAELEILDRKAPSTAQIISSILPKINKKAAFALAVGMVSDSARFKNGNAQIFLELNKLMNICGKSYQEILSYAEPERKASEKINILQAFRKTDIIVYNNFVIATVIVDSNESDIASAISEFADIVFSLSYKNGETRISARARSNVPIALNKIMAEIGGIRFSGSGGGHAKAAGASVKEKPNKTLLDACVEATRNALDAQRAKNHKNYTL